MDYHLTPPQGWMNDPNGLCRADGWYHVFFQHAPSYPAAGERGWGHYRSRDLLNWEFTGTAARPDQPFDKDGVYSGSAILKDGQINLFYTGNVKEPGDYDYINEGRGSATVRAFCRDGATLSDKHVVLRMEDYPAGYSCHIRDPKVWEEKDGYYMVLGARTLSSEGRALLYHSRDLEKWDFCHEFKENEPFGYMWECPDMIIADDKYYLSVSPQGVPRGKYRLQNIYQSGYFPIFGDFRDDYALGDFRQWDYGFDFYAPQTFLDENGRRLLIAWMGLPDIDKEYTNPTKGWIHALTMPREIHRRADGFLCQLPAKEFQKLRGDKTTLLHGESADMGLSFEAELVNEAAEDFTLSIADDLKLIYNKQEGTFAMRFIGDLGSGRTERVMRTRPVVSCRVFMDHSCVEVFLNDGESVMTSRLYPKKDTIAVTIESPSASASLWTLDN